MRYLDSLKFPYVAAKMLVWMGHQKYKLKWEHRTRED